MKVISLNMNGIRAAARKGCFEWLAEQDADFVCVQETKAQMAILEGEVFRPACYHCYFSDAEKKGTAEWVFIQNISLTMFRKVWVLNVLILKGAICKWMLMI